MPQGATRIDHRGLFKDLPAPFVVLDRQLVIIDMNDCYLQVVDRTREELLGRHVFDAFPESGERLIRFRNAFERAIAGEANALIRQPFAIPRPEREGGGMRDVWWTCHHAPVRDSGGAIVGMVQHARDVTAEVEADRMREVISREFDHRVKNILATTAAIARQTARRATSTESFLAAFEARIAAMARTHEQLVAGGWEGLDLRTLVERELRPFRDLRLDRVGVNGPPAALSSRQAQALGLAFHELTTNAAKFGALSNCEGRLDVRWTIGDGRLVIVWTESELAGVTAPRTNGFGTAIIERIVPAETGGTVVRTFLPAGLVCTMDLPQETGGAGSAG